MDGIDMETAVEPIALFEAWMKAAEASELNDASAVALATATRDGVPSVRMVLMKRVDQRGFCFYTNAESQKGVELAENPRAAMCFHWKTLRVQVRISGGVSELSAEEADDYFESRSRLSQLGAVASQPGAGWTGHSGGSRAGVRAGVSGEDSATCLLERVSAPAGAD
jgi:pyridoxamine 5'-phosphate oxidase